MITFRGLGHRGRLGNQLFQLAAVIGLAHNLGDEPVLPASWIYRPYFNVPDEFFAEEIPPQAVEATNFAEHLDPRCRDYLQDIHLFLNHLPEIREYLQPSSRAMDMLDDIGWFPGKWVLAVHVRRGDNVYDPGVPNKADYHPVPPDDYYRRSMAHFRPQRIAVFSDDISWCRGHIPADYYGDGRAYLKEHEPGYGQCEPHDWIDLFTLSWADYFVVTGSTFGIWGALLSGTDPANVVRPNKVYGPLLTYIDESRLFHPEWEIEQCF